MGQAYGNIGESIAKGISNFQEKKKENAKYNAQIKSAEKMIDSALQFFPENKDQLEAAKASINDPSRSTMERAMEASEVGNFINNSLNMMKMRASMGIAEQEAATARIKALGELEQERMKPPTIQEFGVPGGKQQMQWNAETQSWEVPKYNPNEISSTLIDLVKDFEGFNPNAYGDFKQTSIGYGTRAKPGEKTINQQEAEARLIDELTSSRERVVNAIEKKGVSLSPEQVDSLTSFDYNTGRGVSLVERFGDKPEELISKMLEYTKAGGEDLPGLVKRRQTEAELFKLGFTPREIKEGSSFRPATPEEEARFGPGQVDVASNRFYPIQPPKGMTVRSTPEGGFELVEGAGVGATNVPSKAARAEQERSKQGAERTRVITQATADVLNEINSLRTSGVGARLDQALAFLLPADRQGQIATDLETIRTQNSKEEVGKMRAASETGSAGGTITEREWPKFENRFGKLEIGMDPNQIEKNLKFTALNQFEAVHGEPQDVIRLFEGKDLKPGERKITQDEFNRYVENYLETRQIVGIPISGVAGDKIGWTKVNQDLKKYYTGQSLIETSEQRQIVDPKIEEYRKRFGLPQQ